MKAGRELDALVAEKVMGFESLISNADRTILFVHKPTVWNESQSSWETEYIEIPHYSTSIADAWLVVEMYLHKGLQYFALDCLYAKGKVGIWFDPDDFHQFPPDAIGSTVAHAICLAALKLKLKEYGE